MIGNDLGNAQHQCLEYLQFHGGYFHGCGWVIQNRGRTLQVLGSLVKREMAVNTGSQEKPDFKITPYGQFVLSHLNPVRWYSLRANWVAIAK